jgi:short-subunit dehydrogenase
MNTRSKIAAGVLAALFLGKLAITAVRRSRGMRLRGKTAIVCGASRGLGRAIALELAARGVNVAVCARTREDIDDVTAELERYGVRVYGDACDLRSVDQTNAFVARVSVALGPVDLVVANASTLTVAPAALLDARDYADAMSSIFYTALHPVLSVLPAMRARGKGTVCFITSIGGKVGVPHLAAYSAAKFAVVGLSEALRAELSADGVHVVTVVPGLMRTGSHLHATFEGDAEKEYTWFSASATAPLLSIDADRAAKRIVRGIARGDSEVAFTPETRLVPFAKAFFPTLFGDILSVIGRLLPKPRGDFARDGLAVEATATSPTIEALAKRGHRIAERHGQL